MKVLMIGGDIRMLSGVGDAAERLALQRQAVDELDLLVWPQAHSWRDIMRAARHTHYDVVTAQDPFWRGLIAWCAASVSGATLNLQVHADLAHQSLLKRILARFTLGRANSVRVVSEHLKEEVKRFHLQAALSVLPVFVDIEKFKDFPHRSHPMFKKSILWLGRFEPEKDPLYALEVFAAVRKAGVDAGLVMLGRGSMEEEVRAKAQGLPVEFPGWQEPALYFSQADVVLSTSREESWGASIIEALAAGVPVVAPEVGIAREAGAHVVSRGQLAEEVITVLQHGERGILKLPLHSKQEWAKAWRATLI